MVVITHIEWLMLLVFGCSLPAAVRHAAAAPPPHPAEPGGAAPEGQVSLPQHQVRQQPRLGLPPAGPCLQQVGNHYTI